MENSKVTNAEKELYFWYNSSNDSCFSSMLYTLIAKADTVNKIKLELVYPEEVQCMRRFQTESGYRGDVESRVLGIKQK